MRLEKAVPVDDDDGRARVRAGATVWPDRRAGVYRWPGPHGLPGRDLQRRRAPALAPHFTNLDRPVFALVNLPETVKGALFARYSRYQGTLRRLYLDEFAATRPARPRRRSTARRASGRRKLYERIFLGYGDDSVAQLGGAHIACEWVSNVMTKLLQRGRLASYLEQSTRYIPYDAPMAGGLGYRYWRTSRAGARVRARRWTSCSTPTREILPRVEAWAAERFPRSEGEPEAAARALDPGQGARPRCAACCRRPRCRTWASSPPARPTSSCCCACSRRRCPRRATTAAMILTELKAVMPSFVARVERPERGGEWIGYLEERAQAADRWAARLGLDRERAAGGQPARRCDCCPLRGSEDELLAALLFESALVLGGRGSRRRASAAARRARDDARASWWASGATAAIAPGGASRRSRYRFEVVSDYGAFRDLQRHRMLTVQWQALGPDLGAGVPDELERGRAWATTTGAALERSRPSTPRIVDAGLAGAGPVRALPRLPHPLRARHERARGDAPDRAALRARGPPGLPSGGPRAARADRAGAPAVAAAMTFVDSDTEPRLERILSEIRTHARQAARA